MATFTTDVFLVPTGDLELLLDALELAIAHELIDDEQRAVALHERLSYWFADRR